MLASTHAHPAPTNAKAVREHQQFVAKQQAMLKHSADQAIGNAVHMLWPWLLAVFLLAIISAIIKGRMQRWERDQEYRRMAKTIWDAKPQSSQGPVFEVRCADCSAKAFTAVRPDPSTPFYCEQCFKRRLARP